MKTKNFLLMAAVAALLFSALPRISSQEVVTPGGDGGAQPAGGGAGGDKKGVSIMTAEQGEELQAKVDKLLEDQKKLLEKIEQMQKDIEFIKAASRTR